MMHMKNQNNNEKKNVKKCSKWVFSKIKITFNFPENWSKNALSESNGVFDVRMHDLFGDDELRFRKSVS